MLQVPASGLQLVAGTAQVDDPKLLPARFRHTLRSTGSFDRVRIGSADGLRYPRIMQRDGTTLSLVVIPTRTAAAYVVCHRPGHGIADADEASCAAVARTIVLRSRLRTLAPNAGYASAVGHALASIGSVRRDGFDTVEAASTPAAQATALHSLGRTCQKHAAAVRDLPAGPQERALQRTLAASVDTLCDDFRAMASAAARHDRSAYDRAAKGSATAADSIADATRAFSAAGYALG
ncbi:hypothetical protein [Conexibacter woesei]|uniref:hypothetical protein n=1 Tax=Conexibacter woesei TaxID=191495 RepID=UPI00047D3C79|nr:hypothetical protein [Conexibacter woesei]